MSKCPKCEGKGFVEYHAGILQVECDECGGTGEIDDVLTVKVLAKALESHPELLQETIYIEALNDNIRTESDNQLTRSGDTSQPKQIPKAKKKATRRPR